MARKPVRVRVVRYAGRPYGLRWTIGGKPKEQTSGTKNRREADRKAVELEHHLNSLGDGATIAWQDFRTRYETESLAFLSQASRDGWRTAANHLERVAKPALLADVDSQLLSTWVGALIREGKSTTSARTYLRTIRVGINWAWKIGLIKHPIPPGWMPPAQRGHAEMRSRPITAEEFDRIILAVDRERPRDATIWKRFLYGLWHSGMRVDELRRLHWSQQHELSIDPSGRYPMFRILKQKNRRAQFAPMTPDFWALVKDDVRQGYVFKLPARTGEQMTRKRVVRVIGEFGARAGVITDPTTGKTATSHDIGKRAFLTRLVREGYSEDQARQLARHADVETTRRYYLLNDAERLAQALGWE